MNLIKAIENADDYSQLYKEVLVDTPIGVYFMKFLESHVGLGQNVGEIANQLKELKSEHIRISLKKIWLEDFHYFC